MNLIPENFTKEAILERHKNYRLNAKENTIEDRLLEFLKHKRIDFVHYQDGRDNNTCQIGLKITFPNIKENPDSVFLKEELFCLYVDVADGLVSNKKF
ncbi:hypothetical protein [Leptospira interrogans]|uniref:hypothetical protein n=1 Tax=Leptospira interrogans TaxID=173 RepID=UPI00077411F8|nr:hypothetical protein [Leptospira interrogans]